MIKPCIFNILAKSASITKNDKKAFFEFADELYSAAKYEALYKYLKNVLRANEDDPEFLWRIARASKEMGMSNIYIVILR